MNAVDIGVLVIVLAGTIRGLYRGFSGEIAASLAAVFAFLFGLHMSGPLGRFLTAHSELSRGHASALTFVLCVIVALVGMLAIRILLKHTIRVIVDNKQVDRIGGCAAGFVKALSFCAIVVLVLIMWPHPYLNRAFGKHSAFGRSLKAFVPEIRETLDDIGDSLRD
ncbi:MAG: CvpA family protein [Lentisphaerales bacterium]|jgi:uncharacterized membrane protein required for colicin V production|nr:MAG: CvpA family protein [Lentisphaerales bacterium]